MSWYLDVLQKYAVFSGRARRKEYWMFVLVNTIISTLLFIVDAVMGVADIEAGIGVLSGIYMLAIFLPSLGVTIRRLHDTGRSGWALLWCVIPLIGVIVVTIFTLADSQPGANGYGPNPKETPTRYAMAA